MKSIYLTLSGLGLSMASASTSQVDTVRSTISEWATAEKTISREAIAWHSEKILIQDMIAVAQQRVDALQSTIADGEDLTTAADKERMQLLDERERVAAKADRILAGIHSLESILVDLKVKLPDVLQNDLAELYQRIPDSETEHSKSLGERMQTITGILKQIGAFDQTITVEETIRELPNSESPVAFRTLWLGLAQAYYLAPDDAGYGLPGVEGWTWHSQPELASEIQLSMELVSGTQSTPQLVELPVQLKAGGAQ